MVNKKNLIDKFNNELTESPFETCCVCNLNFEESGVQFIVEKSIKRVSDTVSYSVYEYAICWDCAQEFQQKISEASNQAIELYFFNQLKNKIPKEFNELADPIEDALSACLVKGTAVEDLNEYVMCGVFRNGNFSYGAMPYVLSAEVLEELSEQLSDETKDEMDDFRKTYLGGPPELEELLKGKPVVFL